MKGDDDVGRTWPRLLDADDGLEAGGGDGGGGLPDAVTSPNNTSLPPERLRELNRIRLVTLDAGGPYVQLVKRRTSLHTAILAALGVDTSDWNRAQIT